MATGRLTYEDRRRIATGLAKDLSYAEIARGLDRPTSTVTREVMRNGGPRTYRPEQAHRAAKQHRQRQPGVKQAAVPQIDTGGRDPETLKAVEEQLTALLVQTGLPRMPAGVLACLYSTDSGAQTAGELAARMKVSAASISTAVKYLEDQELVRREKGPGRRERYAIDGDIWYRAMIASATANNLLADESVKAAALLGRGTDAGRRLDGMADFLKQVGQDLIESAERWRTS